MFKGNKTLIVIHFLTYFEMFSLFRLLLPATPPRFLCLILRSAKFWNFLIAGNLFYGNLVYDKILRHTNEEMKHQNLVTASSAYLRSSIGI